MIMVSLISRKIGLKPPFKFKTHQITHNDLKQGCALTVSTNMYKLGGEIDSKIR